MPRLTEPKATKKTTRKATKKAAKKATKKASSKPTAKQEEELPLADKSSEDKPAPKRRAKVPVPINEAQKFSPDFSLLRPLDDVQEHLRILLYGQPKSGKTTSAASLANRGPIVVLDCEQSFKASALRRMGVNTENVLVWPAWNFGDVAQLYVTVKSALEEDPESVFALVIDSTSSLAHHWLEEIVQEQLNSPKTKKSRGRFDVYKEDYGTLAEQFKAVVARQIFSLPLHVVLIAHSREQEDEQGTTRIVPDLSPAVKSGLSVYADMQIRASVTRKGEYLSEVGPSSRFEAGDRHGLLEPKTQDLSMLDVVELWENSRS